MGTGGAKPGGHPGDMGSGWQPVWPHAAAKRRAKAGWCPGRGCAHGRGKGSGLHSPTYLGLQEPSAGEHWEPGQVGQGVRTSGGAPRLGLRVVGKCSTVLQKRETTQMENTLLV